MKKNNLLLFKMCMQGILCLVLIGMTSPHLLLAESNKKSISSKYTKSIEGPVTGKVTDQDGSPLIGATVLIKSTSTGTVTDIDGNFSLEVPDEDAILVFSYTGYQSQEVPVMGKTLINVVMAQAVSLLEEIVVTGYGTTRKMDITGSVATLKGDDITPLPSPNFEEGMQGKVPGMELKKASAEPGGGITVKIRGTNSLLGNNEPLYVIDGFPMNNDNTSRPGGWESQRPLNLLSNLNPNDIESVQVLKDASATAIYGSRGANGVIIITTKKGRSGTALIDFEYSHARSSAKAPFELSNVEDYARIENEAITNTGGVDFRYTADNTYGLTNATPQELGARFGNGTDWIDEILQTGQVNNYNLSVQGGNDRTTFLISANYYDETGIILTSNFQKGALRANVSSELTDRLRIRVNMSGSRYTADRFTQHGRLTGGGPDRLGVVTEAFRANPMNTPETPHLEPNDLLQHEPGQGNVTNFIYNPVRQINAVDNTDAMNFFLGSLNLEYDILDDLKITFRGGGNFQSQERINFIPFSTPVGAWWSALGTHSFYDRRNFVFENYANYVKKFGEKHNVDVTLGYSVENDRIQSKTQSGSGYNFDIQGIYGWGQLAVPSPISISESERTLSSTYGRLFYNYDDRYMFTFTARRDGSSVFAANDKWAFFPSGAVAWVISNERFMEGVSWLSNLKLRGSFGQVGNQAIAPYQSLARVGSRLYVIDGSRVSGLAPTAPANPDLIWETTEQLDIGIDASILNDRIQFSMDFYRKNTIDLLQSKPVLASTGYESFTTNFGEISNTGLEISLGGAILAGEGLRWNSTLTGSFNRNKIEDLGTAADGSALELALPPSQGIFGGNQNSTRFVLGQPIGTFWGYDWLGNLSQADVDGGAAFLGGLNEPGDMKFFDTNGDGQITAADAHSIGSSQPDFIFGWDNTFSYKNFTLNFFFNSVIGGKVLNFLKQYTELGAIRNGGGHHSKEYAENHWTPNNTDTRFPRPGGGSGAISTYFLEDATFIRLQNASLSYKIPTNNMNWMRNATIYVRGSNLFVITDYTGFDPESQFSGQSDANANVDLGNYPRPRSVEFGVQLGF